MIVVAYKLKLHHLWYDGWVGKFDYDGQALHNLGVRKYVLAGLGRIGCTPTVMHSHGTNGSCVEEQNAAISDYNNKLKALVYQFNDRFSTNSKFILIYNESNAIDIAHGNKFGFLILQSTFIRDAYNIVFFLISKC